MKLSEGVVVEGRFRLVRPVGRGGMGEVWLAHHEALHIPCAVKFIHAEAAATAEVRARFAREARAAAQLRTPHVVQILDHGECEGTPYIAMEYLEGEDLAQRLRQRGRLGAEETARIAAQVARALTRAHAAGLVHRDLKPANIFLVRDDEGEVAKVLDFGVAKETAPAADAHLVTQSGALLGTPSYMSPEQAQGVRTVDSRSDLWSLAVVVFQCLTGKLPFAAEALGDLLVKIMIDPLPVPSKIAPDVAPGFDRWWARAASRAPDDRFQSARDLSDALAGALDVARLEAGAPAEAPTVPLGATRGGASRSPEGPSPEPRSARPPSHGLAISAISASLLPRLRSQTALIGGLAGVLGASVAVLVLRQPARPTASSVAWAVGEPGAAPRPASPASIDPVALMAAAPTVTAGSAIPAAFHDGGAAPSPPPQAVTIPAPLAAAAVAAPRSAPGARPVATGPAPTPSSASPAPTPAPRELRKPDEKDEFGF